MVDDFFFTSVRTKGSSLFGYRMFPPISWAGKRGLLWKIMQFSASIWRIAYEIFLLLGNNFWRNCTYCSAGIWFRSFLQTFFLIRESHLDKNLMDKAGFTDKNFIAYIPRNATLNKDYQSFSYIFIYLYGYNVILIILKITVITNCTLVSIAFLLNHYQRDTCNMKER